MSDSSPSMERIWAPWRIEYVRDDSKEDGCFLCRACEEDSDRENLVLWRTEHSLCILNRYPYNNGHILVAPRAHVPDISDVSEEELMDQMRCIRRCKDDLTRAVEPDGFNVGLNLGRAAGAGLTTHMHWHIVPRWDGDSNFMLTSAGTKVIPESLFELWDLLQQVDGEETEPET